MPGKSVVILSHTTETTDCFSSGLIYIVCAVLVVAAGAATYIRVSDCVTASLLLHEAAAATASPVITSFER
jgi:hypothetical protein